MPTAIVTGSGGLIGSESVRHLVERGYEVIGLENDMRSRFFGPTGAMLRMCERIAARPLEWSLDERPRRGDHRWWISDLSEFRTDYPTWSLEYDLEATLREIHDANAEQWSSGERGPIRQAE
jgi:NAD(P)-dependent dehydrogenase (short-subunit alcohol dehydrogenase family)